MTLTSEQKEYLVELIEMGDKLEAVRYMQSTLHISAEQALLLTEKLEEEVENSPALEEFNSIQEGAQQRPGVNIGRLVGTIFMVIGGVMLIVAAYLVVANAQFAQRAVPVKGKVIDYDSYRSSNDNGGSTKMFTPIFQYEFNGKTYTHKSSTSSSSQEFEIGELIEILVDRKNPTEILIDRFWEKWFLPILLGFIGVMFTGMGYLAFSILGRKP